MSITADRFEWDLPFSSCSGKCSELASQNHARQYSSAWTEDHCREQERSLRPDASEGRQYSQVVIFKSHKPFWPVAILAYEVLGERDEPAKGDDYDRSLRNCHTLHSI